MPQADQAKPTRPVRVASWTAGLQAALQTALQAALQAQKFDGPPVRKESKALM